MMGSEFQRSSLAMRKERLLDVGTFLGCMLLLIWPALYNGYPILYSDTGAYVASGMRLDIPMDRPITYGLFIRVTSLGGFTLWTVIASQAAITVALIQLLLQGIAPEGDRRRLRSLLVIGTLAIFTGSPWVVSQVMADVFTPILVLCAVLLLFIRNPGEHKAKRAVLYALFFLSVAVHLSHPAFVLAFLGIIYVLRAVLQATSGFTIPQRPIWIMLGLGLAAYPIMSSAISKCGNVMFSGAMVQHGVMQAYLESHCPDEEIALCEWKDRLPRMAYEFHWDEQGPTGGMNHWHEHNAELGRIIRGTITEWPLLLLQVKASLKATWDQLALFAIGDGWGPFREDSEQFRALQHFMSHDVGAIRGSHQYKGTMELVPYFIPVHRAVFAISLLALIPLFIVAVRKNVQTIGITTAFLAGILVNAWGSGTFSGEVDRFGCKMAWLLPFLIVLLVIVGMRKRST